MSTSHLIHLEFILHYITLTNYYIVRIILDRKKLQHNRYRKRKQWSKKCQNNIQYSLDLYYVIYNVLYYVTLTTIIL